MKLQTKLTLASAGVISSLGFILGGIAVASNEAVAIAGLDRVVDQGAEKIIGEKNDKIAAAFLVASEAGETLEVGYIDPSGQLSNLSTGADVIPTRPTTALLESATEVAVSITDATANYRMRAVQLSDGDWVVLAVSLESVESGRASSIAALGAATLGAVLLGALAITLITRRETRKIARLTAEAERIASGDLDHDLAPEAGASEVDQLSRALGEMVDSLQQAVTAERAAQERMQEFLGDASHELRTPLTVVRGYLEMISKPGLPADAVDRAHERMSSEIQRMERLIRDLLQIAELSEATSAIALIDEVDLSEVVETATDDLRVLQPNREVGAEVESGLRVAGREDLLRQLLANLFGNIARHTQGQDRVRVKLAGDGAWAQLDIEDAGPGLPDEAYDKGMDAFKRFDPSRSRENGGSGLGMSIIQGIVRTLGGTMRLSKSELGGLHTCIRLPLVD